MLHRGGMRSNTERQAAEKERSSITPQMVLRYGLKKGTEEKGVNEDPDGLKRYWGKMN